MLGYANFFSAKTASTSDIVTHPADAMLWGVNKQGISGNILIFVILLSKISAVVGGAEKEGNLVILAVEF